MKKHSSWPARILFILTLVIFLTIMIAVFQEFQMVLTQAGDSETMRFTGKEINSEMLTASNDNTDLYFYDQLNNNAKKMYTAILDNYEDLKFGTHSIDFGSTFNDTLSQEDGSEILQRDYQSCWDAIKMDRVDLFFMDSTKLYLFISSRTFMGNTTYSVTLAPNDYENYYAAGFNSYSDVQVAESELKDVMDGIAKSVENAENDAEKIQIVNKLLVDNVVYDSENPRGTTIMGALVDRKAVCEGYAKAFRYIMNYLKIPNVMVAGIGINSKNENEPHLWNYVELGGFWYGVDTTWNDPVIVGEGYVSDSVHEKYLLKGQRTMNDNHIPDGHIISGGYEFNYPFLSITDLQ